MRYNQPVEVSHSCSNNNNFVEKLIEGGGNQSAFFTPQHLIENNGRNSANLNAFTDNLLAEAATLLYSQREINDNVGVFPVDASQNYNHSFQVKSLGEGEINYLRLGLHKVDPLDEEEDSEENCSSRFSCSTESSLADSLMDDGGNDFSSTPSMSSPEPNYTRGIINPNYPGFQHLAHTLTEHFTNYNFEHLTDDSEVSEECDNDLSLGGVDFANNFNNNNHFESSNSNIVSENGNDVEKNINLLQTSECKIFCEEKNLALVAVEEKISNAAVDAKWMKENAKGKRDLPTPDILLKSDDTPEADNFCMNDTPSDTSPHANFQPDLLRNIDGSREIKRQHRDDEIAEQIEIETERQEEHIATRDELTGVVAQEPKADSRMVNAGHVNGAEEEDETRKTTTALWGASPVDIVGDFGEEVEREIVLIVSGYRKSAKGVSEGSFAVAAQDAQPWVKNQHSDSNFSALIHNKIADAELSAVEEKITMRSSLVELDRGSEIQRSRSFLPTAIVKPKQSDQIELPAPVEFCKPWNTTQNVSTASAIRKLPSYDRKVRQVSQKIIDKDTSVAVVTPRKKEQPTEVTTERKASKIGVSKCGRTMDETSIKKENKDLSASFDIYNIETALPKIDLEAIENHLRIAKEEERRKRNDREEIRRRLAMDAEDDYLTRPLHSDKPGRKPSLQSRLQSGMNLQICFMNETASDNESLSSDSETCPKLSALSHGSHSKVNVARKKSPPKTVRPKITRPMSLPLAEADEEDANFFTRQAQLQIEARMALAQAKDMAHMQMEIERQRLRQSPITEMIRNSLDKIGVQFPPEKRRLSRFFLTDLNIAQLQVIVNEMHNQIELLNETLVKFLMERDELHMGQDSMLVDIEDLTRYFGAKENYTLDPRPQTMKTLKSSQSVSH
ncbi:schwannomin-interacting protein 1 homolog isoform X2 [Phlebotomus argentipes]|uniref:schwannomin-interacting protein 1 homolog isoform X2 n=1 Tax=Phlebotomus argentipes TaxID=94469 RepID=UPI002892F91B|nr:schwannomin-interacting protein 1 homolog isoform X2 [Phlebotomus argentipes]